MALDNIDSKENEVIEFFEICSLCSIEICLEHQHEFNNEYYCDDCIKKVLADSDQN